MGNNTLTQSPKGGAMRSRRTRILLAFFVIVAALAVVRYLTLPPHPDSLEALNVEQDDYNTLVVDGKPQHGIVTHRTLNGLLIHLKKTPGGYEPIMGVYDNAEGARVHVENKNGIIAVHTHSLIPEYQLGVIRLGGMDAMMKQIPPEHYDKGPSRFLLHFVRRFKEGDLYGRVVYRGEVLAEGQEAVTLNSFNRGLVFEPAMVSYPKGSELCIRFKLNGQVTEASFPVHELPPRETVSRTLFLEEGETPRFE